MEYFDLGGYSLPVTTTSEEAQTWFDRGLGWTYGYNHEEAVECFRKAIAADPACGMAYWGLAFAGAVSARGRDGTTLTTRFRLRPRLAAPGASIYSTVPGNLYGFKSGTSMATPHVAGVAALLWTHDSDWSAGEIREAMTETAEDLGRPGRDKKYGLGLVRAADALDWLLGFRP